MGPLAMFQVASAGTAPFPFPVLRNLPPTPTRGEKRGVDMVLSGLTPFSQALYTVAVYKPLSPPLPPPRRRAEATTEPSPLVEFTGPEIGSRKLPSRSRASAASFG
ncbi:hypothetical protein GQ53DRAFT_163773 [Thozetella sp. PMI_491]|nr:hypothetical protein GQ53DRAFT_163773 [Thozetella sp. PMI_491]